MSAEQELLAQQRDQALADLVDLERQLAEGEIPDKAAARMRRQYEATAARAIEALDAQPDEEAAPEPPRTPGRTWARLAAYVLTAATAIAALMALPQYVAERPDGGFVTGNVDAQPPAAESTRPPQAGRDLSKVTNAEMEAVIAENPNVLDMRLALAERYIKKGKYEKAAQHYGVALKQEPDNPKVQAQTGWLLYLLGDPNGALEFIDEALTIAPGSPEALWYKANILLDGRKDHDAALGILRDLVSREDLPATWRGPVNQLINRAEKAGGR